jgi:hypothetical protein
VEVLAQEPKSGESAEIPLDRINQIHNPFLMKPKEDQSTLDIEENIFFDDLEKGETPSGDIISPETPIRSEPVEAAPVIVESPKCSSKLKVAILCAVIIFLAALLIAASFTAFTTY